MMQRAIVKPALTNQVPVVMPPSRAARLFTLLLRWLGASAFYLLLTVIAFLFLLPTLWMISTSLKADGQIFAYPPRLLPDPILWENYPVAIQKFPFWLYLRNSVIVTAVATLGTVLSASLVAFGFARRRFPEREWLFGILLSTMMLPSIVTLIPTFVLFSNLGWVNTFLPLTLPAFFGGGAFNIFLLRQFYRTLPYDYDEAAYIDGASSWRVWWSIVVPFSKAPLAVITVFTILASWNDFMGPLIYMNKPHMRTLALGLQFFRDQFVTQWGYLMAASTLTLIPVLILFAVAQRYFMEGILLTGLSGR
ncbi:MAG: carbohydrate ABC transporter permease [Caldilineaceae bacterium]|nr:carbohydrate ABC transporter permease [Caldilineaceae bacterium]